MSTSYKPDGYNSVSPYLVVDGARETVDFLKQVFDAEELRCMPHDNGKIMHAEVRIDDSVIMISDGRGDDSFVPSMIHIYVNDVDAIYERAINAGATSLQAPVQKDDEDKRSGVKDAQGTSWWIATRVG